MDLDFVEEIKEVKSHKKTEKADVFLTKKFFPKEEVKEFKDIPVEPLGKNRPVTPIKLVRLRPPQCLGWLVVDFALPRASSLTPLLPSAVAETAHAAAAPRYAGGGRA